MAPPPPAADMADRIEVIRDANPARFLFTLDDAQASARAFGFTDLADVLAAMTVDVLDRFDRAVWVDPGQLRIELGE